MRTRTGLQIMLAVSILICVWDVYYALYGRGSSLVSWALGAMMAIFAVWIATRLMRGDYSS
jgi:uncharacterized membrane protein YjgN (DUF898 family)